MTIEYGDYGLVDLQVDVSLPLIRYYFEIIVGCEPAQVGFNDFSLLRWFHEQMSSDPSVLAKHRKTSHIQHCEIIMAKFDLYDKKLFMKFLTRNDVPKKLWQALITDFLGWYVSIYVSKDEKFTTVLVQNPQGQKFCGSAKRMHKDKFDLSIGYDIAFTRALREML